MSIFSMFTDPLTYVVGFVLLVIFFYFAPQQQNNNNHNQREQQSSKMGCLFSKEKPEQPRSSQHSSGKMVVPMFKPIVDNYKDLQQVQTALRQAGLESSNLILAIDFTKSNTWTGEKTYGGHCLHELSANGPNPYQSVISIVGRTLSEFDDDKFIPAYGFGDIFTTDKSCFPFFPDRPCQGFEEVLARYNQIAPGIQLSGPTNFAPVIREAIRITTEAKGYHILVIICDGQVSSYDETVAAIVAASNYPISIVCVGVGDGPWDVMEEFDDKLPARKFDNFQFVDYFKVISQFRSNPEPAFALNCLMEIPEQFKRIRELNYL